MAPSFVYTSFTRARHNPHISFTPLATHVLLCSPCAALKSSSLGPTALKSLAQPPSSLELWVQSSSPGAALKVWSPGCGPQVLNVKSLAQPSRPELWVRPSSPPRSPQVWSCGCSPQVLAQPSSLEPRAQLSSPPRSSQVWSPGCSAQVLAQSSSLQPRALHSSPWRSFVPLLGRRSPASGPSSAPGLPWGRVSHLFATISVGGCLDFATTAAILVVTICKRSPPMGGTTWVPEGGADHP